MSRQSIIYIIAFSLLATFSYAQFDPYIQVQQPSPEAEKMCQNSEIPVDLYTGKVNINIPLYTIHCGDIEFPISLHYHGGGILVSDESGYAGLGWTLNATGVVSRIVRGMPDNLYELSHYKAGYERMSNLQMQDGLNDFSGYINLIKHRNQVRDPIALGHPVNQEDLYKTDMIEKYQDKYDEARFESSPDNYMFHVQNLSGAFCDIHNTITLQTNSDCNISHTAIGYELNDVKGLKYLFNELEQKEYHYKVGFCWESQEAWDEKPDYTSYYTSAWWLDKIKSTGGDSLSFSYSTLKISHQHRDFIGFTQVKRLHYDTVLHIGVWRTHTAQHSSEFYTKKDSVQHKILDRIDFGNGYILFHYAPVHTSHEFLPHLDSIRVFSYNSSVPVRRFHFTYYGGWCRELLTELSVIGANGECQKYAFTYYNPIFIPTDSRKYDHWGYYSSIADAGFASGRYFSEYIHYSDKGRYADRNNANNNMLETITYPSGGSAVFEWEPHDFSVYSKVGQQAVTENPDYNSNEQRVFQADTKKTLCGKENHEILVQTITIGTNQVAELDMSEYYFSAKNDYSSCIYDQTYFPTVIISQNNQELQRINITKNLTPDIIYLNLNPGQYVFTLINPRYGIIHNCYDYEWMFNMYGADETLDGNIHISVGHYIEGTSGHDMKDHVGGVRIKSITYKSDTNSCYKKTYTYTNEDNTSSGVLAYPPRYGSRFSFCETVIFPPYGCFTAGSRETNCTEFVTLRSEGLPFVLHGDDHIGYKRVVEKTIDSSNPTSGYAINQTIYKYRTADTLEYSDINDTEHFYDGYVPTDMMQLTSQSYKRGHLLQKTEYSDEIKTTDYIYDIQEKNNVDTLTGAIFTFADYINEKDVFNFQGHAVKPYKDLGIVKYRIIPYNKRILRTISHGTKSDDYHAYTYSNAIYSSAPSANLPVTHTTVTSEGDTIIQHLTYLAGSDKIISCVTSRQGKVIEAHRYDYDLYKRVTAKYVANLSNSSLPQYSSFNASSDINDKVLSYQYKNNRLVEIFDYRKSLAIVYLWSYWNSYPVAEITGCRYTDVETAVGSSDLNGLFIANSPDMTLLGGLRTLLPQCQIITRTFCPLVGMTSETDISGKTTYYEYDGLGRLHIVYVMNNGNRQILKQYEYHTSY